MRLCVDHSADKPSFLPPNLYISARTRCAFPHLDTRLATSVAFLDSHALAALLTYRRIWFTHAIRGTSWTNTVRVTPLRSTGRRENLIPQERLPLSIHTVLASHSSSLPPREARELNAVQVTAVPGRLRALLTARPHAAMATCLQTPTHAAFGHTGRGGAVPCRCSGKQSAPSRSIALRVPKAFEAGNHSS